MLATRVAQKKAEIVGLEAQIPMQVRLVDMQKERLEGRQKLFKSGAMSKKQVLEVESLYEQARIQLNDSDRKLALAKEAVPEAEAALAEAEAEARKLWSEELAKASSELAEVEETIRKHVDKVDRLVVRAPTRAAFRASSNARRARLSRRERASCASCPSATISLPRFASSPRTSPMSGWGIERTSRSVRSTTRDTAS